MDGPFACASLDQQTYSNGRKFYVWGMDAEGAVANVPETFSTTLETAVPGEATHAWDLDAAQNVAEWDKPILIEGLYGGMYLVLLDCISIIISNDHIVLT
jgi:hypothetical protein